MAAIAVAEEDKPDYNEYTFTAIKHMEINNVSTKEQLITIENLAYEIWYEHYIPIIGKDQVEYMLKKFQSVKAMTEQIKNGLLYFLVLDVNAPLGYMSVEPLPETLFLSKLYVKEAERGKGYGKTMIAHLEALAKEKDLNKISLTVNKYNRGSIAMYEKIGFVISGSVVKDIGEGFIMDDFRMEKRL